MKKLLVGLSLMVFLMFGAISIQSVMADASQADIVNVDNIPDKEKDNKKDKATKSKVEKSSAKDASCAKYDKCCKASCEKSGSKDTSKNDGKQK